MKITREHITIFIATLLAILFFYAAMSKITNYDQSKSEMLNQIFPSKLAIILTWLIPTLEIIITFLLLYRPFFRVGFLSSTILLGIFSFYIAVVMTGVFGRIPCSCGGILKNMSYGTHLLFNLVFLNLGMLGIRLNNHKNIVNTLSTPKERRHEKLA